MKKLLGEALHIDRNFAFITIVSTLLLTIDSYLSITSYKYLDRFILYLLVPLAILLLSREDPRQYGFTLGDWKIGLTLAFIAAFAMTPLIFYLGRNNSAMKTYYGGLLPGLPWTTFLDLFGWEFFFRGWILFGYAKRLGTDALWLHAVPFALAHIGKPEIETLSTIFGGFAFGWIAWRTKSFLWPFLIHWYIGTLIIVVSAGVL